MYTLDLYNVQDISNITYFEVNENTQDIGPAFAEIDRILSKRALTFKTKHAIVVTYNNIQVYNPTLRSNLHTFQAVFASDGTQTYGIFNYEKTPELTLGTSTLFAKTGFFEDGNPCVDQQEMHPGTPPYELAQNTNSNVTGRYIYAMSQCSKYPCNVIRNITLDNAWIVE